MDDGSLKPKARDGRRQAIVDVARDVFVAEGFAEASMAAIATKVGGSKGTLYNYFPSKQDLFAAVIRDQCDRKLSAMFDGLQAQGEDIEAALREVGRNYAHLVLGDDSVLLSRLVIAEVGRFPELGRALYESGPKRGRARMATYIEAQMNAGRIRCADATRVVDQFCEMCLGNLYRQRLLNVAPSPSEALVNENVDAAVTVLMEAYGPRPDNLAHPPLMKPPAS